MKIKVSAQVPLSRFGSGWEDPDGAAQEFSRFMREAWLTDLEPLADLGLQIRVSVETQSLSGPALPGVEVQAFDTDFQKQEVYDMLRQTRELLSDQETVWKRFLETTTAKALFGDR